MSRFKLSCNNAKASLRELSFRVANSDNCTISIAIEITGLAITTIAITIIVITAIAINAKLKTQVLMMECRYCNDGTCNN